MIYTLKDGESFNAETLRQELVAALGPTGWYINTSGDTVNFVSDDPTLDPSAVIEAHFANGAKREHNAAIRAQLEQLDRDNALTQRNLRDLVIILAQALKAGGPVDLTATKGVVTAVEVEAQAEALRQGIIK